MIRFATLALCALLSTASSTAQAATAECPSAEHHAQLTALRDRIAGAESTEEAQELALDQTRLGHEAIDRARQLFPADADIAEADARLTAFEEGIAAATSPAQVADQLDTLDQTGATAGRCDYTNGEIVVIIIGFLLGILPGILFLFLFC